MQISCQILFSGKNKKDITNFSSAELGKRVIMFKIWGLVANLQMRRLFFSSPYTLFLYLLIGSHLKIPFIDLKTKVEIFNV